MLKVYSARIEPWDRSRVEKLADAAGVTLLLDITRKSGKEGVIFAPSWDLLKPALEAREKAKKLKAKDREAAALIWTEAWETYVVGFLDEMRASYRQDRDGWEDLLALDSVCLLCYCDDANCCHRHLLRRRVLPMLGAVNAGELGVDYPAYRIAVTGTRPPRAPHGGDRSDAEGLRYARERRIYDRLAAVCRGTILGLDPGAVVVHGNADGMGSIARDMARERGLVDEAHPPRPEEHGGNYRTALLARNSYVTTVGETGRVLAFPAPTSRGTWHAIGLAEKAGVKIERCWERVWQRNAG